MRNYGMGFRVFFVFEGEIIDDDHLIISLLIKLPIHH
jgi:hypothetical protein